jgi:16S rRNA (guanine966-N2)-methyltransferase
MPKRASVGKTPSKGRGWLRIIGGVWRGRKFAVPEIEGLRPTNERAREAIFNRLMHAEDAFGVRLKGATVADLFAGTGALGLEALSRGAKSVLFVEREAAACRALAQTIQTLVAEDRADVTQGDASTPAPQNIPFDLILMDPPYSQNLIATTLIALSARGWTKPGTLVVAETETGTQLELPPGYALIDQRRYGRADISFITFKN